MPRRNCSPLHAVFRTADQEAAGLTLQALRISSQGVNRIDPMVTAAQAEHDAENVVAEIAIVIVACNVKAAVITTATVIGAAVRNGGTVREMEVGALLLAINTTTKAVTPCAFEIQA